MDAPKVNNSRFIKKESYTVLEDRRLKVDDISEIIGLSHKRVYRILTQERDLKTV